MKSQPWRRTWYFIIITFLNRYPSEVTVRNEYTRILLPDSYTSDSPTDEDEKGEESLGNFAMYQLTRVMWKQLSYHAKHAHDLVNKMVFSRAEYEYFLNSTDMVRGELRAL